MLSLTRAEIRMSLVFAAILWFMTIFEGDFYLTVIITWAVVLYVKRWHVAHPGASIFDDPEQPRKEAPKAEPAPATPAAEAPKAE